MKIKGLRRAAGEEQRRARPILPGSPATLAG